jgi:hypothetical protein
MVNASYAKAYAAGGVSAPWRLSVWRRIGAPLHGGDGVHERARVDAEIQVGGRR